MRKYSEQFRHDAVKAYVNGPKGLRRVAKDFNMDCSLLRRWVAAYRIHGNDSFLASVRVRHSPQFKLSVLQRMWKDKLSCREVAALFGLKNSSQVGSWEQGYYSGGIESLASQKPGRTFAMPKQPAAPQDPTSPDDSRSREQLLAEIDHLRMEVDYLKKLKALREEKARLAEAKKRK
jgi:transposase